MNERNFGYEPTQKIMLLGTWYEQQCSNEGSNKTKNEVKTKERKLLL